MKPTRRHVAVLGLALACLLGAAPAATAQDAEPAFMAHLFAPELVIENMRELGLGKAQRRALLKDIQGVQSRAAEIRFDLLDAMEELDELAAAPELDEAAMLQVAGRVFDAEARIKAEHLGLLIRVRNALTPEQRERLRELRREDAP